MKSLVLYTSILPLWEIFECAIELSPLDAQGYFTITMVDSIIRDIELEINPTTFWNTMRYFLYRQNKKIIEKRRLDALKRGGK